MPIISHILMQLSDTLQAQAVILNNNFSDSLTDNMGVGVGESGSDILEIFENAWLWVQHISLEDWAWLGVVAHLSLTVYFVIRILSSQRNTGVAIAWLVLLFAVPIIGMVTYMLIGEPYLGKSYKARNVQAQQLITNITQQNQLPFDQANNLLPARYRGVSRVGILDTGFGVYDNHNMRLLTSPDTIFDSLIKDINNAQTLILMEFYIIFPKGQVQDVFVALIDAAKRGVECQILADSVGSFNFFEDDWLVKLEGAGVIIHQSLPVGLFKTLFKRTDLRNHRKIVVIDDSIGYTGSFNLVDPQFFKQDKNVGQWIDLGMRIISNEPVSVVTALATVNVTDISAESSNNLDVLGQRIDEQINMVTRKLYRSPPAINDLNDKASIYLSDTLKEKSSGSYYTQIVKHSLNLPDRSSQNSMTTTLSIDLLPPVDGVVAQLIPSAPRLTENVIYNTLLTVMHRSDSRIQITTPYFVPDEALLSALTTAAKRGVEVTLIVPHRVDSFLVQHASQASYSILMEAGVKIALFKGGLLHAKTVVIDDDYCLFGTVNMDMRSFYLNMEVSLALYTPAIVAQVLKCQRMYLTQCEWVDLKAWNQRSKFNKLFDSGIRLFSPLL